MMEQTFLKQHFVGRDGFIWWIGQIASEESWIANIAPAPVNTASDLPGVGERYKVRIMGYHTTFKTDLPDDDLPWASVMYPVTAGTGNRGYYENAQLAQGNFVFGFFLDGDDAQQVGWLQKHCTQNPLNKLVLVNGNYVALSESTGLRLYFDQQGKLTQRLNIRALPAVLRQRGDRLYVEEIPLL